MKHIGILSIGEMGYHWARLLSSHGIEVLTYAGGRSEVTQKRATNAGVRLVPSMRALLAESDLVVSVVVPLAAKRVASQVARSLAKLDKRDLLYLDANAISPMTAREIDQILSPAGAIFVDGCIIGSAARIGQGTLVCLSGPDAERLEELKASGFSTRVLGTEIGQASAFKVVYAGLTKGLQGLFVELLIGARKFGLLREVMLQYEESFPGLLAKVAPSVVGLRIHAGRRAEEMAELSQTYRYNGLRSVMAPATRKLLQAVAALDAGTASGTGEREGSLLDTLELFFDRGLLRGKGPE